MINITELELFIKKILVNGTAQKSKYSLEQLKSILVLQSNPEDTKEAEMLIKLIDKAMDNLPEFKEMANYRKNLNTPLSQSDIDTAMRRAADRKRREAEMAARGRC